MHCITQPPCMKCFGCSSGVGNALYKNHLQFTFASQGKNWRGGAHAV